MWQWITYGVFFPIIIFQSWRVYTSDHHHVRKPFLGHSYWGIRNKVRNKGIKHLFISFVKKLFYVTHMKERLMKWLRELKNGIKFITLHTCF